MRKFHFPLSLRFLDFTSEIIYLNLMSDNSKRKFHPSNLSEDYDLNKFIKCNKLVEI